MSIDEKVEIIGDSLHDIRGAIEGAGVKGLGNITTYADAIEVLGGGQRRIGEIITSTIPLTDAGVHLLDGSLISGSGSYSAFVDYIISLYYNNASIYYKWEATFNGTTYTTYTRVKTPTTDDYYYSTYGTTQIQRFVEYNASNIGWQVDGSGTIYYATSEATLVGTGLIGNVTPTPPSYFCTEDEWQQSVTDYGVCGKFVYDSVNNTVRLPKITGFIEGTTDVTALGDLVEAGLPNIWYSNGGYTSDPTINGALSQIIRYNILQNESSSSTRFIAQCSFDASRCSSIYGNSSTVQPQTIKVLYYIVIATTTKTAIQVDIDEIATDLNGKADVDLTNINNTGYIKMAGAGMPSDTYTDLTLGANGSTYTAPANGYVQLRMKGTANLNCGFAMYNTTMTLGINFEVFQANAHTGGFIPVKKGDVFSVDYWNSTVELFRFIYAQGSEREAS